jgi:hypothetical protein
MASPLVGVRVDLRQSTEPMLSQMLARLAHSLRGHVEVAGLDARVWNGKGGNNPIAVSEQDTVKVADLLDTALLFDKLVEHLQPDAVGYHDHFIGSR